MQHKVYNEHHNIIDFGVTEVFKLAESFLPLVKKEIEMALQQIKEGEER